MNTKEQMHTESKKTDHLKSVQGHPRTAIHIETVAKHLLMAALLQEKGKLYKVAQSTPVLHAQAAVAHKFQKTEAKLHADLAEAPFASTFVTPLAANY